MTFYSLIQKHGIQIINCIKVPVCHCYVTFFKTFHIYIFPFYHMHNFVHLRSYYTFPKRVFYQQFAHFPAHKFSPISILQTFQQANISIYTVVRGSIKVPLRFILTVNLKVCAQVVQGRPAMLPFYQMVCVQQLYDL